MASIEVSARGRVATEQASAFEFFRDVDLTSILTGMGPFAAVVSVESPSGRWDESGLERTLHLADGQSLRERLTVLDAPHCFDYEIDRITGPLGRLVTGMSGRWSFESGGPGEPGSTLICWRYVFHSSSRPAWLLSWPIVRGLWQRYMQQVLDRTAAAAVRES